MIYERRDDEEDSLTAMFTRRETRASRRRRIRQLTIDPATRAALIRFFREGDAMPKRRTKEMGITVKRLIAALRRCPSDARVYFLDTDDPDRRASYVCHAEPVPAFQASLGPGAAATVREAGLRKEYVVITGVND